MVKLSEIIKAVEKMAPLELAEEWDNSGLQIGDGDADISKILICLDVDEDVLNEALELGVQLIISHHPLFFKPIFNISFDRQQGKIIRTLIKNDINLYSAHTSLDSAVDGVNDVILKKLGLNNGGVLQPSTNDLLYKIVVFVPEGYEDAVRYAMTEQGAGHIGNYSDCTFRTSGSGTFRPLEGTNPFIGEKGKLENVPEVRVETIAPQSRLSGIIKKMLQSCPYEEVAYDIYKLENKNAVAGLGRIGVLRQQLSLGEFIDIVKSELGLNIVKYGGNKNKMIKSIAVCGGAGGSMIKYAAAAGVDLFLTGDMKYHEAQQLLSYGMAFIDGGHFATENPVVTVLRERLAQYFNNSKCDLDIYQSVVQKDVFKYE